MDTLIQITEPAQEYLCELLAKQDCEGIAIRVFVLDGGTPKAETCLAFSRPGEEQEDDEIFEYQGFRAYVEKKSLPYLEEALVDYSRDSMGGQLTIKAPNSRMPKIHDDSSARSVISPTTACARTPTTSKSSGALRHDGLRRARAQYCDHWW